MGKPKLDLNRFVNNSLGEKTEARITSVNLEVRHLEFLKIHRINLSKLIRAYLDEIMKG